MKAGCVAGVMDHGPAHPPTGVVRAERDRVGAGDHPWLGPVQAVRARFVADPVGVRVPERAGVEPDDAPPGPGQTLHQGGPAGPAPDDDDVDLVIVGEAAHVGSQPVVGAVVAVRDQPG